MTVVSTSCVLASTMLTADTQPAVSGQPYELLFTVSDKYGNPCGAQGTRFAMVAMGFPPLVALVTGKASPRDD